MGGVFEQIYSYAYDDADDTLTSLTVQNGSSTNTISYSYDYLKRLSTKSYGNFTQTYNYKMLSETRTSTLIDEFKWTMGNTELRYNYTYDNLGNIQKIFKDGVEAVNYAYDEQGQLLLEYNTAAQMFYMYHYDTYGNIRDVDIDDISDGTIDIGNGDDYVYNDPTWLDRLTAFNGVPITYDNAGNPLSYYNGSAYTLTWQNGRELATATKGEVTSSYKYNIDGQRVQKTVGNVVYDYYYADGLLVRQTWGNNYIDFIYDESGIFSFVYNGTQYYYIKNLQGDVVAISNASGTILVEYVYDAWGDVFSITGTEASTIGTVNPIRYRGYYFDTDTEFYYLNSRYYDPEIRRFINADTYVNVNGDFIGFNMYAYCLNNPVMYTDYTGESAVSALKLWSSTMWWLVAIDGFLPIGDIIYVAGTIAMAIGAIYTTVNTIEVITHKFSESSNDTDKDESKDNTHSLPTKGNPNSDQDLYDESGELKQRRHYGPDGRAEYDIDYKHPGENHKFPHRHNWDWSKNPPRSGPIY